MKYILALFTFVFPCFAFAMPPGILARTNLGREYVGFREALDICPKGYHLPTIREWANWAKTQGAKGILEKTVNFGNVPEGYYLISAIDPNGKVDEFYFSNEGFPYDVGSWGENGWCFWSSSVTKRDPRDYAYLIGPSGYLARNETGILNGKAWCMPDSN